MRTGGPLVVTITNYSNNYEGNNAGFDWSANYPISVVKVKAGTPSTLYTYDPATTSDTGVLSDRDSISHVNFCYNPTVDVEKTAVTTFDRDWEWTINKSNDSGSMIGNPLLLNVGQSFEVEYTVFGGATAVDDNFAVSGTITITNPEFWGMSAKIDAVTDVMGGIDLDVTCPYVTFPHTISSGGSLVCTYSYSFDEMPDEALLNVATAVASADSPVKGGFATAAVAFDLDNPTNETNTSIDIEDSLVPSANRTVDLEDLVDGAYSFTYTIDLRDYLFSPEDCGEGQLANIASFSEYDYFESLVYYDLTCETGCTLSQGYWRTHSIYGPAPYDENWANVPNGAEDAPFFLSGKTYYEVLWTPPAGGNAYYQLAHQWIAAYLNVLNGADIPSDVLDAWTQAQTLFETYTPAQAGSLRGPAARSWRDLAEILDKYNNGLLGPGKCSES
ncbi:MAG: hypothetical protein LAT84_11425 [Balneolia bacterium]|nr:hypothetical protein [Balneolia bacterium]